MNLCVVSRGRTIVTLLAARSKIIPRAERRIRRGPDACDGNLEPKREDNDDTDGHKGELEPIERLRTTIDSMLEDSVISEDSVTRVGNT